MVFGVGRRDDVVVGNGKNGYSSYVEELDLDDNDGYSSY